MEDIRIVDASSLKPGKYVVIDDAPCRVVDITRSKPGKHGEAKLRIVGIGVFDDRKRELFKPAGHKVHAPMIDKRTAQVLTIVGGDVQLMDMETYETFELPMPEDDELKNRISEGVEVFYMTSMGQKKIFQIK